MPLEVKENTAVLSGHAEITEAEVLLEWLRSEATPVVDLSACASALQRFCGFCWRCGRG